MEATFKIKSEKLDSSFVEKIKLLFDSEKTLKVTVTDEMDETEYLLSTEKNAAMIAESLQQFLRNETVTISEKELLK
ncbi:MAG: hypothetical protein ACYCVH_13060 [Ignavibacteriaceae bacterium]